MLRQGDLHNRIASWELICRWSLNQCKGRETTGREGAKVTGISREERAQSHHSGEGSSSQFGRSDKRWPCVRIGVRMSIMLCMSISMNMPV